MLRSSFIRAAAVCYLLENGIASGIDDAIEQSSDVSLFEGTVEDYAWEYLEHCVFTKSTPKMLRQIIGRRFTTRGGFNILESSYFP